MAHMPVQGQTLCPFKKAGDATCKKELSNGVMADVSLIDFEIWRKEKFAGCSQNNMPACGTDEDGDGSLMDANFNYTGSGNLPIETTAIIDLIDFNIWRNGYFNSIIVSPTPSPLASGIWISQIELAARPTTGAAWTDMKAVADSNIGTANLADQDSTHPEKTLAVALVAAKTNDPAYKTKAVNAIMQAIGTENNPDPDCTDGAALGARSLALGRNLIGYIVAADVLNFRNGGYNPNGDATRFQIWVHNVRFRKNCPNNSGATKQDLSETHDGASSNGNALAGASRIAAAAYLRDTVELDRAWATFRRYAGDKTVGPALEYNSFAQTWAADLSSQIGINPKGSTKNGSSIDGVIPNDQGRGGDFTMPPGYTQYPWEGIQGMYAQALILDRLGYKDSLGKTPWHVSDDALLRAVEFQWSLQQKYGGTWFDSTRAAWVKHLTNKIYGKSYPAAASGGGRNMDYTQWTHQ